MAEKPILFSGEMVRAILSGRKTQTRRVVKPQPPEYIDRLHGSELSRRAPYTFTHPETGADWGWGFIDDNDVPYRCPYGRPGDRLWVRETWQPVIVDGDCEWDCSLRDGRNLRVNYRATDAGEECGEYLDDLKVRWRPSIHMPRWASRLTLAVTNVRVERLNEISEADAKAEGVDAASEWGKPGGRPASVAAFESLWDSINAARGYDWASNPWVWVVEFEPAAPAAEQEETDVR